MFYYRPVYANRQKLICTSARREGLWANEGRTPYTTKLDTR